MLYVSFGCGVFYLIPRITHFYVARTVSKYTVNSIKNTINRPLPEERGLSYTASLSSVSIGKVLLKTLKSANRKQQAHHLAEIEPVLNIVHSSKIKCLILQNNAMNSPLLSLHIQTACLSKSHAPGYK